MRPRRKRSIPKTLTYLGRTQSVYRWAKELGLKLNTVCDRLARGLDAAGALAPPRRGRKLLTVGAVTQPVAVWAAETGLGIEVLTNRMGRGDEGADVLRAVERPAVYTHRGVTGTIKELARVFGLKSSFVYGRMKRGMSLAAAIDTPRHTAARL